MAYSYLTVEFIEIPIENEYLGIDESISGLGLNEIFKNNRVAAMQTIIPPFIIGNKYEMTVEEGISIDNIGVTYTPIGGSVKRVPLSNFPIMDLPSGGYRIEVLSEYPVIIYDIETGNDIAWPYGYFELVGTGKVYSGYISDNYKTALDADYNLNNLFTIQSITGEPDSGLGTVIITANFSNAFFSVPETFPFATITIHNEAQTPIRDVNPDHLVFNVNIEIPNAPFQNLQIISSAESWEISNTLPSWLQISSLSGTGSMTLEVKPKDYSVLNVGQYSYAINVKIGTYLFEVPVTLNVAANIRNPFKKGRLYFTRENIYLGYNSEIVNTYLHLEFKIDVFDINTNVKVTYLRSYDLPLFKGKGEFYVGDIVDSLLNDISKLSDFVPDFKTNYVKKQFKPAEVSISFNERNYSNHSDVLSGSIEMFKMIKGYRPFMTTGDLALLTVAQQEITRITPKSVISTSFVYIGKPRIMVKINNVVVEDFEVDQTVDEIIYSYYRFNNNVKPGDSVEIIIIKGLETRTQRFLVFKNGLESSFLFFENTNGLIEPYEFSGRRRVNSGVKHTTTKKIKNRASYEKKIFTENSQGLTINTGQLLKTDHRVVVSIIRSENVWCSFDGVEGNYISIDSTTTKLINQDTSNSEEDFDIEFNILEDTDASIYPQ
ncbi:hypothetical protein [Flavobacterium sp. T12S277]|uniref:hypothetical protein n=1 Tax=Flavobacterium sp. T12S277 TaxID=3402752 RepID=UPI003AE6C428